MPLIVQSEVRAYLSTGSSAASSTERGNALEDLICYVFGQVPGISVTRRNQKNVFQTEEIDVAFWNDGFPEGFFFLPNIVLVKCYLSARLHKCKNWSQKVGSAQLSWFDAKLRSRGLSFGVLIASQGITGNPGELTAAHSIVAGALREGRRLVVITSEELTRLQDSSQLIYLVKEKLCDLAVNGTVL